MKKIFNVKILNKRLSLGGEISVAFGLQSPRSVGLSCGGLLSKFRLMRICIDWHELFRRYPGKFISLVSRHRRM